MATSTERSFAQELNTWVQTIGIVIAAGWGVYTFVYKELVLPKSAPVNITVDIQLKNIGTSAAPVAGGDKPLVAVEMRVSATNPSSRMVYLFPTAWMAYGINIDAREGNNFDEDAIDALNSKRVPYATWRHAKQSAYAVVAVGQLFPDEGLNPKETTTRTLLMFVPPGKYDYLDVSVVVPSTAKQGDVKFEWRFDEAHGLTPYMYRIGDSGKPTELPRRADGEYDYGASLELQQASSLAVLSLWGEKERRE